MGRRSFSSALIKDRIALYANCTTEQLEQIHINHMLKNESHTFKWSLYLSNFQVCSLSFFSLYRTIFLPLRSSLLGRLWMLLCPLMKSPGWLVSFILLLINSITSWMIIFLPVFDWRTKRMKRNNCST